MSVRITPSHYNRNYKGHVLKPNMATYRTNQSVSSVELQEPTSFIEQEAGVENRNVNMFLDTRISNDMTTSQGKYSQNLNYNFDNYQVLRTRIFDRVSNTVRMIRDPYSSLNRFLSHLSRHSTLHKETQSVQEMLRNITKNANELFITDTYDHKYFDHMNQFVDKIQILRKKILSFSDKSDAVDEFNPKEATDALDRIIKEFESLEQAEAGFPKEFRSLYIKKY